MLKINHSLITVGNLHFWKKKVMIILIATETLLPSCFIKDDILINKHIHFICILSLKNNFSCIFKMSSWNWQQPERATILTLQCVLWWPVLYISKTYEKCQTVAASTAYKIACVTILLMADFLPLYDIFIPRMQ